VRLRVCEAKGRDVFWYRTAVQPVPLGASELGAPSKVTVIVARSAGEGPLISMYVPAGLASIYGSNFENGD
jgi:hypothetical protein